MPLAMPVAQLLLRSQSKDDGGSRGQWPPASPLSVSRDIMAPLGACEAQNFSEPPSTDIAAQLFISPLHLLFKSAFCYYGITMIRNEKQLPQ